MTANTTMIVQRVVCMLCPQIPKTTPALGRNKAADKPIFAVVKALQFLPPSMCFSETGKVSYHPPSCSQKTRPAERDRLRLPLPAPAKQTQAAEAGGEERESCCVCRARRPSGQGAMRHGSSRRISPSCRSYCVRRSTRIYCCKSQESRVTPITAHPTLYCFPVTALSSPAVHIQ